MLYECWFPLPPVRMLRRCKYTCAYNSWLYIWSSGCEMSSALTSVLCLKWQFLRVGSLINDYKSAAVLTQPEYCCANSAVPRVLTSDVSFPLSRADVLVLTSDDSGGSSNILLIATASPPGHGAGTNTTIVHCTGGHKVYIECWGYDFNCVFDGDFENVRNWSTFSGFLLNADAVQE